MELIRTKRTDISFRIAKKAFIKHRQIYIMLIPIAVYYAVFCYAPMFGNIIAFQDFSFTKGFLGSKFVGVKHFIAFLNNYKFWSLVRNTLMINIYNLLFRFPAPIILALLLNEVKNQKFKRTVQTVTYLPHFISMVVVAGIILDFVATDGLLNEIRRLLGAKEAISFMTEPAYFYAIYTISGIWQEIGWDSIIYIAALSSINQELYEAAAIDGANRWRRVWHITLPGIMPTIIILFIMKIGQMLSVGYEKVLLLYNPTIYETADVISTYVYRRGILEMDYSYSAAVGLFNSVINFALLISVNAFCKRMTGNVLW